MGVGMIGVDLFINMRPTKVRDTQPAAISIKAIRNGLATCTYFLLYTENIAANTAHINPAATPAADPSFNPDTMNIMLGIMIIPTATSSMTSLFLKINASTKAVKKEVVAKQTRAIDALDNLILA